MMTSPREGSKLSKQVCLRYVTRHPVAFREYFTPRVSRRRYWHRYTFSPPLLAMDQGDASVMSGRGSGKSFAILEPEIVRQALDRPGEETMLTSFRKLHVVDRLERAIDYFEMIPFFKAYIKRIVRSPSYTIELRNAHMIYGISVGDDPEAKMAQGKHVSTMIIEEAQQYPERAWLKLQGAKDPRGCRLLMAGVPDGSMNSPFRKADGQFSSFEGRRFRLSRRYDPYFDQKTKNEFAETLGGEEQDTFLQEVDAEWANPSWSAWDLDSIYACMEENLPLRLSRVAGKLYRQQNLTPLDVVTDLPRQPHPGAPIYIAMDVGYSQPSEIGIWESWYDRWHLIGRLELVDRMEHNDQAAILRALGEWYGALKIGIDTTEGEGRAIAHECEENGWAEKIVRVGFTETLKSGYTPSGEEVWEHARSIATRVLRAFFGHRLVALPRDEDIATEFNQEKEKRTAEGTTKVVTPPTVHITDMMRVFAVMVFLETPPVPPDLDSGAFEDCVWGDRPGPWAPTQIQL